jgi:hypothetical protein
MFGGHQMSAFVNEQQKDKSDREPKPPSHGVNPNHKDHGAAGFDRRPPVFEGHQQGKLKLGKQRGNAHADRPQRLLQPLAEARALRRRWRRREAVLRILILIHGVKFGRKAAFRES